VFSKGQTELRQMINIFDPDERAAAAPWEWRDYCSDCSSRGELLFLLKTYDGGYIVGQKAGSWTAD